jgi:hypothetical protein
LFSTRFNDITQLINQNELKLEKLLEKNGWKSQLGDELKKYGNASGAHICVNPNKPASALLSKPLSLAYV